jgi:pSer/pThr/pTyr-binding forkhead associated (FHA) protein
MACLVVNCEGLDLVTHELKGTSVMIGRALLNHIVIDHPTVSAQHAILLRVGDSYWLKDLNSMNGTLVNNVLVSDAKLKDGDTIRFGSVITVFERCRKRRSRWRIRRFWTNVSA